MRSDPARRATGFAAALLRQLDRFAQRGALPRVRALHLPLEPDPNAARGEFCALELDDGSMRCASTRAARGLASAHRRPQATLHTFSMLVPPGRPIGSPQVMA